MRRPNPKKAPRSVLDPMPLRPGEGRGGADEAQPPATLVDALRTAVISSAGRQGAAVEASRPRANPSARTSRRGRLLPLKDVAEQLQVSIKTIRRWIERGLLPEHRLGRLVRVSEEDLDVFVSRQRR